MNTKKGVLDFQHPLFAIRAALQRRRHLLSFVDLDTAAAQSLLRTVVIKDPGVAPDLDAELIWRAIIGHELELAAALAIDRPFTFELRAAAGYHKPFVDTPTFLRAGSAMAGIHSYGFPSLRE